MLQHLTQIIWKSGAESHSSNSNWSTLGCIPPSVIIQQMILCRPQNHAIFKLSSTTCSGPQLSYSCSFKAQLCTQDIVNSWSNFSFICSSQCSAVGWIFALACNAWQPIVDDTIKWCSILYYWLILYSGTCFAVHVQGHHVTPDTTWKLATWMSPWLSLGLADLPPNLCTLPILWSPVLGLHACSTILHTCRILLLLQPYFQSYQYCSGYAHTICTQNPCSTPPWKNGQTTYSATSLPAPGNTPF